MISKAYLLLGIILFVGLSWNSVSAVESGQCSTISDVRDIFTLRDDIGLSLGHTISSIHAQDTDRLQTGAFVADAQSGVTDLSSNIVSRLVNLVLGNSDFVHANGADVRQEDASCSRLPLESSDCYVRYMLEDNALMDNVVHFIPMTSQVLDAILNTVGFFQELDIPAYLQQLSIPVTFNGLQRRRLEESRQRLHDSSLQLSDKTREALREYLAARNGQADNNDNASTGTKTVSDLHRRLFGVEESNTEMTIGDFLQSVKHQKRLRRRNQAVDFADETQLGNSMLSNLIDYFLDIADFLGDYSDVEESGTCIAYNNETFAMSSTPGFPSDVVYDFCNCASSAVAGFPFCPVKPQVNGFAASSNKKLSYDISDLLGNVPTSMRLFDGLGQQNFATSGDVWVALDMATDVPKLSDMAGPTANADAQAILDCAGVVLPTTTTAFNAATTRQAPFLPGYGGEVLLKTSLLTALPSSESPSTATDEFLSLVAFEESNVTLKIGEEGFFNFTLFPGYGSARLNAADPTCQPSGFFMSNFLNVQNISTGTLLAPFIEYLTPASVVNSEMDFGFTFASPTAGPDFTQSIFLKSPVAFKWLGFILNGDLHFQYLDESEIIRRRNFDLNSCCEGMSVPCSRAASPVPTPLVRNESKPAINILLDVDQVVPWGSLTFQNAQLSFNYQLNEEPEIFFDSSVLAPGLNPIPATVRLEKDSSGNAWTASFLTSLMDAVDSYPVSLGGTNLLQPDIAGTFNVLPDWDLFFQIDWESATFVSRVEESVLAQLPVVIDSQGTTVSSVRSHNGNGDVWDQIMDLGKDIGVLGQVLEVLDDNFLGIGDLFPAMQVLKGIFDTGSLDTSSWSISIAANLNIFDLGTINFALSISDSLLQGNLDITSTLFEEQGWDFSLSLGVTTTLGKDEEKMKDMEDLFFGCDIVSYEYEDLCTELPDGQQFGCRTVREGYFPEPKCFRERTRKLHELYNLVNDELWFGTNCGTQVNRADLTLAEGFSISSPQTIFPFGEEQCGVSFDITFPQVSIAGTIELGSIRILSDICLFFDSIENIATSLSNLQENLVTRVLEITTGGGGSCTPIEERLCDDPLLTIPQFTSSASITCNDDLSSLNLGNIFGVGIFDTDESCTSYSPPIFDFDLSIGTKSMTRDHKGDSWDGCGPLPMSVQRYGKDCCQQISDPLVQTLNIERVQPQFLTAPGTMNVETTCDANVHPRVIGMPEFEKGCQDSVTSVEVQETSTLDADNCTTTIERTYVLREDGCEESEQRYIQNLTLSDTFAPQWDFFPEDVTLRIFDSYGTDTTGFPKAIQVCGKPIDITYTDTVVSTVGDTLCSSGYMLLERTFKAVDTCGRELVQTQTIHIGNEELPIGTKALSFLYAGEELIMDEVNMTSCLVPLDSCGVTGADTGNACGAAKPDEFSDYAEFLNNVGGALGNGILRGYCFCEEEDCLLETDGDTDTYFAVPQVVDSENACSISDVEDGLSTRGNATTVVTECPGNPNSTCTAVTLSGEDPVYNIFRLQAEDLGLFTIQIDVPATSFTLINVASTEGANVTIDPAVAGVQFLTDGLDPSRIIWNFPSGVNLKGSAASRTTPYVFQGTMFNRLGSFEFDDSDAAEVGVEMAAVHGQVFARKINTNGVRFDCSGHFVGFFPDQSCEDPWEEVEEAQDAGGKNDKDSRAGDPDEFLW